ncbi:hypothetical protein AB1N83_008826 [Pleurotus pulmonarius]
MAAAQKRFEHERIAYMKVYNNQPTPPDYILQSSGAEIVVLGGEFCKRSINMSQPDALTAMQPTQPRPKPRSLSLSEPTSNKDRPPPFTHLKQQHPDSLRENEGWSPSRHIRTTARTRQGEVTTGKPEARASRRRVQTRTNDMTNKPVPTNRCEIKCA